MKSNIMKSLIIAAAMAFASVASATKIVEPPAKGDANASGVGIGVGVGIGSGGAATVGDITTGGGTATVGDITTGGSSVGDVSTGPSNATALSNGGAGGSSRSSSGSTSYSASGDVMNSIGGSKFLSFPQPVWTSVPTAFGCIVTKSVAGSGGWNFVSGSKSEQYSEVVCTTIRMAEAATQHCHFLSAAHLNRRAFELMHPGQSGEFFMVGDHRNLSVVECEEFKRPILRVDTQMQPSAPRPAPVVQSVEVNVPTCQAPAPRPAVNRGSPANKGGNGNPAGAKKTEKCT